MSLPAENVPEPVRPRRHPMRGLCAAAVTLVLLALIIAVTLRAGQPRWRTYTFPADPRTGIAVAIDYPDSLQLENPPVVPITRYSYRMRVDFRRKPPTGLARWWLEKVARQDVKPSRWEFISISVSEGPLYRDMTFMEGQMRQVFRFATATQLAHIHHPLGSALEIAEILDFSGNARIPRSANLPPPLKAGLAMIYPTEAQRAGKMLIAVECLAPEAHYGRLEPIYNELVRRIHFVKK